jgi:hypothetical protein
VKASTKTGLAGKTTKHVKVNNNKTFNRKVSMNSKLIILVFGVSSSMAFGVDYKFNFGSAGWTYSLVNSTTDVELRSGTAGWSDINNYPNVFTDPVWNGQGAAQAMVGASDYSGAAPGDYLLLQFASPDLAGSADWQSADILSARLLLSFTAGAFTPDVYANMIVIVNDLDTGTERTFASGSPTLIADATWTYKTFDIASAFAAASPAVVDYELKYVIINFCVAVASDRFIADPLPFDIDNVLPRSAWILGEHLGPGVGLPAK